MLLVKRANALVLVWLLNSCASDIRSSVLFFTSQILVRIMHTLCHSDGRRVFHPEKSLSSIQQSANSILFIIISEHETMHVWVMKPERIMESIRLGL